MDEHEARVEEFLRRPLIATALSEGFLPVKRAAIETRTDRLVGGWNRPPNRQSTSH